MSLKFNGTYPVMDFRFAKLKKTQYKYIVSALGPTSRDELNEIKQWNLPPDQHLILEIDDLTYNDWRSFPPKEQEKYKLPSLEHISHFLNWIQNKYPVLIHCLAGVSRSSALCYIAYCQFYGPRQELLCLRYLNKQFHWPNEWIVQLGDKVLNRNGAMLEAVQKWKANVI